MSLKTFEMTRELLNKQFDKPGLFVLVPLFVMPLVLGIGCMMESVPIEENPMPVEEVHEETEEGPAPIEEEPAPIESGPVPFEVLREARSASGDVYNCRLNFEYIALDSSNTDNGLSRFELVIDNPEDFADYFTCRDTIHVDFNTEFVLAGASAVQGNFPGIMDHTVRFSNDTLYYEIGLLQGFATMPGSAYYAVKVLSRDYLMYPIVFDVYWAEEYRW
jgi:hypothetical protein